jgi:hypothetical protein
MEHLAGETARAKAILEQSVKRILDPQLWSFYVEFVRSTRLVPALKELSRVKTENAEDKAALEAAISAVDTARSAVSQAFDFTLKRVGLFPGADELWESWMSFIKSYPASTEYEIEQRREALRKAFHRYLAAPSAKAISGELWAEYQTFEVENAQAALAARLLEQHRSTAVTAGAVARERAPLWVAINTSITPVSPPVAGGALGCAVAGSQQVQEQLAAWRTFLDYEYRNPLRLGASEHLDLMKAHLQRCLLSTRSLPDAWVELAFIELRAGGVLSAGEPLAVLAEKPDALRSKTGTPAAQSALRTLVEGCIAAPQSQLLALFTADAAELMGAVQIATQTYQRAARACPGPALWINWIRFARRSSNATLARQVFMEAKKWPSGNTPSVFLAMAEVEACVNSEPATALKVLDLGRRKLLPKELLAASDSNVTLAEYCDFAVAACRIASTTSEAANTRSLFEGFLELLPSRNRAQLLALYLSYEMHMAPGAADLKRIARLELRCLRETGSLPVIVSAYSSASSLSSGVGILSSVSHRWQAFGHPPASGPADMLFLSRHEYHPQAFREASGNLLLGDAAVKAGAAMVSSLVSGGLERAFEFSAKFASPPDQASSPQADQEDAQMRPAKRDREDGATEEPAAKKA